MAKTADMMHSALDDVSKNDSKKRQTAHRRVEETEIPAKRPQGRPRADDRDRLTIKPLTKNKQAIRRYAFEHDVTMSDVIDALVEKYLDTLEL